MEFKKEAEDFNDEKLQQAIARAEKAESREKSFEAEIELLRSRLSAADMKLVYLEQRVEETYHVEVLYNNLKEDYESMRKDRAMAIENLERRQLLLSEENGNLKRDLREMEKAVCGLQRENEMLNSQVSDRDQQLATADKRESVIRQEKDLLTASLNDKREKIDIYISEIHSINKKILEFNSLVDALVQENKRLEVRLHEYEKKDIFMGKQSAELHRLKSSSGVVPAPSSYYSASK